MYEYDLRFLHAVVEFSKYNMKVIHWKSKGPHFDAIHQIAENNFILLNEYSDLVAEMAMINNILPVSFPEILEVLNKSEERFEYLSTTDLFDEVLGIQKIQEILDQIISITDKVKESLEDDEVSELETYQYKMRLESKYKCKMRLK